MSVECSMLAIAADRYEALRADPIALTDEVRLRRALDHLAVMCFFKKNLSEAEVLAEIRANRHWVENEDPKTRREMAELYAREDALVDAALARGDRERPFGLGTNWQYLNDILTDGPEPRAAEDFFLGAPRFGKDVGYGPAGLHDPAAVVAFAAYLDRWSPERFAAVAEARRPPDLAEKLVAAAMPGLSLAALDADLFLNFKAYIADAAAARAAMLIWMD